MEHKNIVATIYLKNGQAVKGMDNFEPMGWDVISLAFIMTAVSIKSSFLISQTMTKNTRRISIPSKISTAMSRSKSAQVETSAALRMSRSLFMPDACRLL